jgi:hypothetical protein
MPRARDLSIVLDMRQDKTNISFSARPRHFLHDSFWRYGFETNWDLSTVNDVEDFDLSCAIKTGIAERENTFMLNNHFSNSRLGLPTRDIAEVINVKDFLQTRLEACTERVGRRTNLLAVDFWSIGDVVEVVNIYNSALPEVDNVFSN